MPLLVACMGPPVIFGGFSLNREIWETDERQVRQRAAFELQCPAEQIYVAPLTVMSGDPNEKQNIVNQIGVTGCGHRLVYVRGGYPSGWVLNSSDGAPK